MATKLIFATQPRWHRPHLAIDKLQRPLFTRWMKSPRSARQQSPFHPPCHTCFSCFQYKQTFFPSVKPTGSFPAFGSSRSVASVFALGFMRGWEPGASFYRSRAGLWAQGQRRTNERGTKEDEWAQKQWIRNCLTLSGWQDLTFFFFLTENYWSNLAQQLDCGGLCEILLIRERAASILPASQSTLLPQFDYDEITKA